MKGSRMFKRTVVSIASGIFFFSLAHTALAGFGITPPYVRNSVLRPGAEFVQEIVIVRSDPVEDLNAEITINVPGIEQWFFIDPGLQFILPKGEKQVRMNVTVRVPEDASLGPRSGNIRIRTYGNDLPSSGVSLALGAQIDVAIDVVEEVYDFEVRRVELPDVEEGRKRWWLDFPGKMKFQMHIENTGNIPAAPVKVEFDIFDTTGTRLFEHTEHTNAIPKILPFNTKKVIAEAPTHLGPGAYRARYKIYKNTDTLAQTGELALAILPKGTIPGYKPYGFLGLSLNDQLTIVLPLGVMFIAFLWFFFGKSRGRKGKSRKKERVYEDEEDDGPEPPPEIRPRPRQPQVSSGVVDLSRRR